MSKELILNAETRSENVSGDKIPAVVYGPKTENVNVNIKLNDFIKVYNVAKGNTIIDLVIDEKTTKKVLVKSTQIDPVKDIIIHVDFYELDMDKKVEVEVSLNFINESKAVKELGGLLSISKETVTVGCLPGDLITSIDVDLATLEDFSAKILVNDLQFGDKVEVLTDGGTLIANVIEPKSSKHAKHADAKSGDTEEAEKAETAEEAKAE